MDTHGPYEPPGEYATLYADEGLSGRDAQSLYQRAIEEPESITEEERQLLVDLYDGEIRYNDMRIGEFFDSLRERGLLENSLLIVTADHGDAFGEHGYYEHPRYLHDEVTHVPLLVHGPGLSPQSFSGTVSTLDVTDIIEAGEKSVSEYVSSERTVFSQARGEGDNNNLRRYAARRNGEVCFCQCGEGDVVFTKCSSDQLRNELENHIDERSQVSDVQNQESDSDISAEVDQRLDALGYK